MDLPMYLSCTSNSPANNLIRNWHLSVWGAPSVASGADQPHPWEIDDEALSGLMATFQGSFKGVTAYHSARPIDFHSYFTEGLMLHNESLLLSYFKALYPQTPETLISAAFESQAREGDRRAHKLHLHSNLQSVLDNPDTLIYGSGYLMDLSDALQDNFPGFNARQRLLKAGQPTIIETHIPWSKFNGDSLHRFFLAMLGDWIKLPTGSLRQGFSFSLDHPISVDEFGKHWHPVIPNKQTSINAIGSGIYVCSYCNKAN